MPLEVLGPCLEHLRQEYVLVQAWKKTAAHLRAHNWYCDTLEVDWTTLNLAEFIERIQRDLERPELWESEPLRVVWAPKTQRWRIARGVWRPKRGLKEDRLRPLAHVSLRDQVVATGLMLCLANRLETRQRDPRSFPRDLESLQDDVTSYGNRLFCDRVEGELRHRWGSKKLYRSFFEDYRAFVRRPTKVAESWKRRGDYRVFVVESDLAQFYDRVRRHDLARALHSIQRPTDDTEFFSLANRVLRWCWDGRDTNGIARYRRAARLNDFSEVVLPQGLVAAGFFANAVLLAVDEILREDLGQQISGGIWIRDVVRYVDDIRVVVTTLGSRTREEVEREVSDWLDKAVKAAGPDLQISPNKTAAAEFEGDERPVLLQSVKMERLQKAFSGGFDLLVAEEILETIRGLLRSQADLKQALRDDEWGFSPRPDVRDETIARFGAWRYRTTYRSIRPLLSESGELNATDALTTSGVVSGAGQQVRTRSELDNDARVFAFRLVNLWLDDPSNVRVLRIALDIWPEAALLREILGRLRRCVETGARGFARQVAWYCLAELFRAGATETGIVDDDERLADGLDVSEYRQALGEEALRVVGRSSRATPWYARQQALLFLATWESSRVQSPPSRGWETRRYWRLIEFLQGGRPTATPAAFATLAVLATKCFSYDTWIEGLGETPLSPAQRTSIAVRDASLATRLYAVSPQFFSGVPARIRNDLCVDLAPTRNGDRTLAQAVLGGGPNNPLRNELSLLRFVLKMLDAKDEWIRQEVVTPTHVHVSTNDDGGIAVVDSVHVSMDRLSPEHSLYRVPAWCDSSERWRFQLGFLLRFILTAQPDFTAVNRRRGRQPLTSRYLPAHATWYARLYGMSMSQTTFGDDWLPITEWMESFLLALVRWPGCHVGSDFQWVGTDIAALRRGVEARVAVLEKRRGHMTRALVLPTTGGTFGSGGPFRACVVQTVIPNLTTFRANRTDPTLSHGSTRKIHRRHLSATLEAVKRMLALRETHFAGNGSLDLLVLPELAVHPDDVQTHLIPFVRQYKAMVLTGLTYHSIAPGNQLINSALWLIPERTGMGLRVRRRRQGKRRPTPREPAVSFHPCQWVVEHSWKKEQQPLRLTASVCYDATDLSLATDLRDLSDVYLIPALNRDVATFDKMALALHYHMFQLVVVVNNGQYGGSNAYWPRRGIHEKQLFHLHGQPQASIAFLDIDDIPDFLNRIASGKQRAVGQTPKGRSLWKYPPAGM